MDLKHTFTVPVPPETAWAVLTDVERIAPCMPGATLEGVDGKNFRGSVKVKVGPMQLTYRGEATFAQLDPDSKTAVLHANGRETRGPGTARATVTAQLAPHDGATLVTVETQLQVTGKPAQFGRGVLAEVGAKLLDQFATCLARELADATSASDAGGAHDAEGAGAAGEPAAAATPREAPGELDVLRLGAGPVLRRAAAPLLVLAALALLVRAARRAARGVAAP